MTVDRKGIFAYCSAGLAFHISVSAFTFYYVKVFNNVYHVPAGWFQTAHIIRLAWAVVCYPLVAYIQDHTNLEVTRTRRQSILFCAPLFALTFLLPWIQIGENSWIVGVHLVLTLFCWDSVVAFMGLAVSALLTEMSEKPEDRARLTQYAQIVSLFGPSVTLLEFTSNSLHDFQAFHITTIVIALCIYLLFTYTGINASTKYDLRKTKKEDDTVESVNSTGETYFVQIWQILSDSNFQAFVLTNFCHGFHRAFLNSYLAILCDQLISDEEVPSDLRKTFYGGMSWILTIVVIIVSPFVVRYSYYYVIRSAFVYIIVAGIIMLFIGQGHPWCLMFFLIADSCASGVTYSLFNMTLADIAVDNKIKYGRKYPISSTVFGTSAVLSRPAISLSPMITAAILNSYGYGDRTTVVTSELTDVMFTMACCYPIILGSIQLTAWTFFDIHQQSKQINII